MIRTFQNYLAVCSIFFISLILGNCQQKESSTEDRLYTEVMASHDTIMDEMQTIVNLKSELEDRLDSLEVEDEEELAALKNEIELAISELNLANESMMNWMRNFNRDFKGTEELTREQYLESENEKIKSVGDQFNEAIRRAEDLLERL